MSRLRITEAGAARVVEVEDRATIGRDPSCDIVLEDAGVSREHAELTRDGDGWTVRDLGSRNGTSVNGEPVEFRALAPGDVVGLGPEVTLEVLAEAPDRDTRPGPRGRREPEAEEREPRERRRVAARPAHAHAARPGPFAWLAAVAWTLEPRAAEAAPRRLGGSATTVGRDPASGLVLDDESVSRVHARLEREGGSLVVTDLKSRNGTFVNDAPVLRAPLEPGDEVRFGDVAFLVARTSGPAWARIGLVAGLAAALVAGLVIADRVGQSIAERARVSGVQQELRAQVLESVRDGIAASRTGDPALARDYLLHAADLMLLADLAPRGSSIERPVEILSKLAPQLPAGDREFDFAGALDPSVVESSRARLATLTNREYVEYQLRRYAIELNQDKDVPPGFVDQVWGFVQEYEKYPGSMREMLRRARDIQPRIRNILASRHLPESFCYVAWVESGLDPTRQSPKGALGLWQLMPAPAREFHLRVAENGRGADDRTDIDRSTLAAADFFARLLRDQGPEYFMLVLASYNRGPNALERAKQQVSDPMLPATRKYWYLVDHRLLPQETRDYVPRIFAVRLIAEAPARFGFEAP